VCQVDQSYCSAVRRPAVPDTDGQCESQRPHTHTLCVHHFSLSTAVASSVCVMCSCRKVGSIVAAHCGQHAHGLHSFKSRAAGTYKSAYRPTCWLRGCEIKHKGGRSQTLAGQLGWHSLYAECWACVHCVSIGHASRSCSEIAGACISNMQQA
jgi:hypothetical protein